MGMNAVFQATSRSVRLYADAFVFPLWGCLANARCNGLARDVGSDSQAAAWLLPS